jgi:glycolate oxidase
MRLKKEQYQSFEDIVGSEFISDDPEILYSYSWRSGLYAPPISFSPLFEACLLPRTNEEVVAIVKLCNKYGLQFKASSTGWGPYNDAGGPGCLKLDLRRMNQIIEINEENMYAVVEPGVTCAQLHAETMKRGLNCNQNGAGTNCSASPIVAHCGFGCTSQSGSYGERNQLGLEWITPEGELVKLGALGSVGEWFCGDGPGPSLRGAVRGNVVPMGGLGVFTKAAEKLYHWPGPSAIELAGHSPKYVPQNILNDFTIKIFSFPDANQQDKASQLIGETEIAFELMGFNRGMAASNIATSNPEMIKLHKQFMTEMSDYCLMVVIGGYSANDKTYKEKTLNQIAADCQGVSLKFLDDNPDIQAGCLWRWTRPTASIREVFRATGCFAGEVGGTDVARLMLDYIIETAKEKQVLIDKKLIFNDGTPPFFQSIEHGHTGHGELLIRYIPDRRNWPEVVDFGNKADKIAIERHFGVPGHVFGDAEHDKYGPHVSNYHIWLRKIKAAFDPNEASEGSHHITNKKKK